MRPGKASELKSTGLGPGVMQMAQGAPGDMVPVVEMGLLPIAGRASAGAGTSIVNWRRNFPFESKTWMRRLPLSATYILCCAGTAMLYGTVDWSGGDRGSPPDLCPVQPARPLCRRA